MGDMKKTKVKVKAGKKARIGNVAGGDIVVHPPQDAPKPPSFSVEKRKILPLTERALNITAAIATLVSLGGMASLFRSWLGFFRSEGENSSGPISPMDGITFETMLPLVCVLTMIVAAFSISLRLRMKRDKYSLPNSPMFRAWRGVPNPGGRGRRLAFERLTATCPAPSCGAEMKFFNQRGESKTVPDGQNGTKEVSGPRKPMMVCRENPFHDAHRVVFDITWKPESERTPEAP